jgi:hypothetical protein
MIAANNGYVLAFDNLSGLPSWLPDALCRLATGGSFAVRQLYTSQCQFALSRTSPTRTGWALPSPMPADMPFSPSSASQGKMIWTLPTSCAPASAASPATTPIQVTPTPSGNGRMRAAARPASTKLLPVGESAALCERLLNEVAGLQSHNGATAWASQALALKNSLTAADAQLLEHAFAQKLSGLPPSDSAETSETASSDRSAADPVPAPAKLGPAAATREHQTRGIDKSVLTVSTPRRYRNKEHLRFVAQQPCLLCARKPSDTHHLRFVQPRALGRKASDEFAVPLCRSHHRAVHRAGNEQAWWKAAGIDPLKIARKLWKLTRMHEPRTPSAAPTQDAAAERPAASDRQGPGRPTTA